MEKITEKQIEFLNKHTIGTWELNQKTGLVDIDGDFDCRNKCIKDFCDIEFGTVKGYFNCSRNNLTTLKGAPRLVYGYFDCSFNKLTSLEGAPEDVWDDFICSFNELTSLEGAPKKVSGYFICQFNELTTLKGAPNEVQGDFICSFNFSLKSIEGYPQLIGGKFIV